MADRAKKVSELTSLTAASGDDLLLIVDDPSGTPATKKITIDALFTGTPLSNGAFVTISVSNTATIENAEITTSNTDTATFANLSVTDTATFANLSVTDTATFANAEITTSNTDIGTFANVAITNTLSSINTEITGISNNFITVTAGLTLTDQYTPSANPIPYIDLPFGDRPPGNIFWDNNYLYIIYQNNHAKRIPLESFLFFSSSLFYNQNSFFENSISTN